MKSEPIADQSQRTSLEPFGLSRRNLLIGLAVSATAVTAADAATAPKENPELLAMTDALPAVRSAHVAARDNLRAIVAEWSPHWPATAAESIPCGEGCTVYRGLARLMWKAVSSLPWPFARMRWRFGSGAMNAV